MTTQPQHESGAADPHPHQAASDEADPEKQSTPAGVVKDLEEEAEAMGASTDPVASDE
jgi:hypothetical protein